MELRCGNRMHGVVDDDEMVIEVKCSNNRCGARSGTVVLHRFSLITGALLQTRIFRDPMTPKEGGGTNGDSRLRTAVRHP